MQSVAGLIEENALSIADDVDCIVQSGSYSISSMVYAIELTEHVQCVLRTGDTVAKGMQ